jgi:phenylpropionate dioxygenase-like ring-hydroxylating dioxygenase large terminal subunit
MKPNYPFNCWYVAATAEEVGQSLLGRRLLGLPVVLYRTGSGEVVAMEDRCVHRAYPLSAGDIDGDRVVCGYHGFAYDPDGSLVDVPSQENVPPGACVRTYPVQEESPFVWIWLGEPGVAALRPPPRTPWFADPEWASTGETLRVEANYMLLHEHYLDLTNIYAMHPELVPPGLEALPAFGDVDVSEMSVSYHRAAPPVPLTKWEVKATGLPPEGKYARRESGTFVSPALHVQRYSIDVENGKSHEMLRIHGFTPETPTASHVFLQIVRNYGIDSDAVGEEIWAVFRQTAERDAAVLETVQRQLGEDLEPRRDINVKADRAAVRARRVAQEMVRDEAGRAGLRPILAAAASNGGRNA